MQHLLIMHDGMLNNTQLQLQPHFALHQLIHQVLMDVIHLKYLQLYRLRLSYMMNFILITMILNLVLFDDESISRKCIK